MELVTKRRRDTEEGFTLIELIVCTLIISILAAAATEVWFHQRRKAWVVQVRATIRHMAGAQNYVIYNTASGSYTASVAELEEIGFNYSDDVVPEVVAADRETFCIQMTSTNDSSIVWHYSSVVGYPEEGPGTAAACGMGAGSGSVAQAEESNQSGGEGGRASTDGADSSEYPSGSGPGGLDGGPPFGPPAESGGGPGRADPADDRGGTGAADSSGAGPHGAPTTSDPKWNDRPSGDSGGTGSGGSGSGGPGSGGSGTGGSGGGPGDGGCRGDRNDPDGDNNGGRDEIGGSGGDDPDRDCNNGSGNDDDGADDNNAGGK